MKDNRINLNELKNDIVRCIIPFKDIEGNEKQIEVYNIIGDRRSQILEKLKPIIDVENGEEEYALHEYYVELISEFTDVKLDITDVNEVLINPTLEFQILRKEIDDMVYELQYELICKQLKTNRFLMLNEINKQSVRELKAYEDFVENSEKMIESFGFGDDK